MPNGTVRGAFDQGQVPTISCFNKATVPLGVDFDRLIAAMQKYVDQYFAPVWGTPAKLVKTNGFVKRTWAMVFLDTADVQGALAYHDLTPDGLPLSKVFVKTTLQNGDKVSVSASHELVEMLADPAINLMSTGPRIVRLLARRLNFRTVAPRTTSRYSWSSMPVGRCIGLPVLDSRFSDGTLLSAEPA